jgi:transporter family protein
MNTTPWIAFSLFSGFLMAVVNMIDRYVLTRLVGRAVVPLFVLGVMGFLPGWAILMVKGGLGLAGLHLLLAVGSGLAFLTMGYFYFRAAQVEEISRVVPLFYLSPALVAILAHIFLGEQLAVRKYFGIILILAGAVLLASRWPVKLRLGPAFGLMILAASAMAVYTVATKYLLNYADYWTVFALSRLGMFFGTIPIYLGHRRAIRAELAGRRGLKVAAFMAGNEGLALAGSFFFTWAAARGPISVVTALSSTQPFFVFILSLALVILIPRYFKEDVGLPTLGLKMAAIAVMFSGLIFIV